MASLTQPLDSSSSTAQLGLNHIVAEEIRMELAEKLNVYQLGVVPLVGDFAGAGTTTIRDVVLFPTLKPEPVRSESDTVDGEPPEGDDQE